MIKVGTKVMARGEEGEVVEIVNRYGNDYQYLVRVSYAKLPQLFERDELLIVRDESGPDQRLSRLIERLHAHDELAAKGLEEQFEGLWEDSTWDDAPGARGRYLDQVEELADTAETILGAYEEV